MKRNIAIDRSTTTTLFFRSSKPKRVSWKSNRTVKALRQPSLVSTRLFLIDLLRDRRTLLEMIDLCQMLRDLLTVNELTNWNIKASIEAKSRALKCHIQTLKSDTQEYQGLCEMLSNSTNRFVSSRREKRIDLFFVRNRNDQVFVVHQIYSLAKPTDALQFRSNLFNQKQLFHGSKYNHFLWILSRGFLMPKVLVEDLGIARTDIGCLGSGIYFSDSVSTSVKYPTCSRTRPARRLLCVSQVTLANSAKFYSFATTLTEAPANFHSAHGVKNTGETPSKFLVRNETFVFLGR